MSRLSSHRRAACAGAVLAAFLGLSSCGGDGPTPPPTPRAAPLALAPTLPASAAGGPTFDITMLRAVLAAADAPNDSIVVTAPYAGAGAALPADLTITTDSRLYDVKLAAYTAGGDTVFRAADTVRAVAGDVRVTRALTLAYARADAGVTAIQVAPRDTTVSAGDTLRLRVAATAGGTATPAVGWTSRDATGLTLSTAGTLTAAQLQKTVWVVATTFTGVKDSTRVTVAGAVASVAASLDSVGVARGDSVRLDATLRDAAGTVLTGRPVTWSSSDAAAATVSAAGWVTGRAANQTARIVVTADGKSDTVTVTVAARPVATVTITSAAPAIAFGDSVTLAAESRDDLGDVLAGQAVSWTSLDPARATVDAQGVVRAAFDAGAAAGSVPVVASVGGHADTVTVALAPVAAAALLVTPVTPSVTVGDSVTLAVAVADAQGRALTGRTATFTSLDPARATVDAAGKVRAAFTGSATPGTVGIEVAVGGVKDTATVTLDPVPATVTLTAGDLQVGVAGQGFLLPVTVTVTGPGGVPLAGRDVSVVATEGGGSLAAPATTDANGAATLALRYGAAAGPHGFSIRSGLTATAATVSADATLDRRTVAAASNHACTTDNAGALFCWGSNSAGQLGNASVADTMLPVPVSGGLRFATVAAGLAVSSVCALTADGTAYCWGASANDQLANDPPDLCGSPGSLFTCARVPRPVAGGLSFVSIDVATASALSSATRACGVTATGDGYCWGAGSSGERGDGATGATSAPGLVAGGLRFVQISTGSNSSCGVTAAGEIWCWGANAVGQLGNGTTTPSTVPVRVSSTERFVLVDVGGSFGTGQVVCALSAAGRVYCWGNNTSGRLGTGTAIGANVLTPTQVAGGHLFSFVAVGEHHACAIETTGDAYCWGRGSSGQLGTGQFTLSPVPVLVSGGHRFRELSPGVVSTCGRTTLGYTLCWGTPASGNLGIGDLWASPEPTRVRLDPASSGAPANLVLVGGTISGRGLVNGTVSPPAVRVLDATGTPVPGATVTFAATGGGSVGTPTATTDAFGLATAGTWTLGPTAGANTVTATAAGVAETLVFSADGAVAGPAANISFNACPCSDGVAGETLSGANAPSVRVTDATGLPVAGTRVLVEIHLGGGSISPANGILTTDANGAARLDSWTLGTTVGVYSLTGWLLDAQGQKRYDRPVAEYIRYGSAGPPVKLATATTTSGGTAGQPLATGFGVAITDQYGNVVTSATTPITFSIATGPAGATLGGTLTKNAVNGVATFTDLTLSAAGTYTLQATASGLAPVTTTAITIAP